jgi:hypothetical protein
MRDVIAQKHGSKKRVRTRDQANLEEACLSLFVFVACLCSVALPLPIVLYGPPFIHTCTTLVPEDLMNFDPAIPVDNLLSTSYTSEMNKGEKT